MGSHAEPKIHCGREQRGIGTVQRELMVILAELFTTIRVRLWWKSVAVVLSSRWHGEMEFETSGSYRAPVRPR
jgi:hypothetical protein